MCGYWVDGMSTGNGYAQCWGINRDFVANAAEDVVSCAEQYAPIAPGLLAWLVEGVSC